MYKYLMFRTSWQEDITMGGVERKSTECGSVVSSCQGNQAPAIFQKETQTETTLFEDPFTTNIQPYTLFGEYIQPDH